MQTLRIVFMGTPDFAVPCLQTLLDSPHSVVGVFTQPDKPQGRKMVLTPPPVKVLAAENGVPVFQPEKMKDPATLEQLEALDPDLIVVVAYGRILPRAVLELPRYGCINVHASLLPKYRGAAAHSVGHLRRRNRDRRDHYANGRRTGHRRYAAGQENTH